MTQHAGRDGRAKVAAGFAALTFVVTVLVGYTILQEIDRNRRTAERNDRQNQTCEIINRDIEADRKIAELTFGPRDLDTTREAADRAEKRREALAILESTQCRVPPVLPGP